MLWSYLLLAIGCFFLSHGAPFTKHEAMQYLADYGYMDPMVMNPNTHISAKKMDSMVTDAVTQFQEYMGLKVTGKMDLVTIKTMKLPRCGVKDKFDYDNKTTRRKRYALWGTSWMKKELTYSIKKYPKLARPHQMLRAAVEKEMFMAFSVWAHVTNLFFKRVDDKSDIDIAFQQADINNENTRNFEIGALAYATMPPMGDITFNDDKKWTIRRVYGWNLLAAAVHEIGHALGLEHSNVSGSIMHPLLTRGYTPNFTLDQDDIDGIQELYGKKEAPPPDICEDSSFDAIFNNPDGSLCVLKGQYYWRVGFDGLLGRFAHLIRYRWPELPDDIDTALATSSGRTYFFKGDKYWAYEYTTLIPGHPRLISEGWPGIPNNLDGATWYRNSQFYFFKGEMFWLFDSNQNPNVPGDFPKHITEWGEDAGSDLEDVMYLPSGYLYFFKGGYYLRYSNYTGLMDDVRSVRSGWLHC